MSCFIEGMFELISVQLYEADTTGDAVLAGSWSAP